MTTKTSSKKRAARTKPAATKATALVAPRAKRAAVDGGNERFAEVIALIEAARARGYQAVNTVLVQHYWELGAYISRKMASAEWGDGGVEDLAADLARRYPGARGYTRRNLFRMRQFFGAYRAHKKVSPLVTQLAWTHHLIILSEAKPVETREFYILAIKERWSKREVFFEDSKASLFGRRGKDAGEDARSGDGTRIFQARHENGSAATVPRAHQ